MAGETLAESSLWFLVALPVGLIALFLKVITGCSLEAPLLDAAEGFWVAVLLLLQPILSIDLFH